MSECSRCGECCRWMVVARKRGLNMVQLSYLRARSHKETEDFFLVLAPCNNLFYEWQGKECPEAMREIQTGVTACCRIYDKRPLICKEFRGVKFSGGYKFYVPETCALQGFCILPSGEGKDKAQGTTK